MSAGVAFTCYVPANVTALLIVIAGYTEAQMLALSEELCHLWDDAQQNYFKEITQNTNNGRHFDPAVEVTDKNKTINEYIKLHLIDIIKRHATNLNLLRQVEDVFRGAIAAEFVLLICGLTAELLGGLENTYIEMPFAIMQVGMDCLTGQGLIDANVKFENALYDCKWENFDVKNMKIVLLMLQNSQKTMTLSAGGITILSFSCFMSIIRLIYSAYTTLRSTLDLM
uniref:Odorant receptor n=1 Tax=Eogystia hippophaecolus TaxID=1206364 RepID=A0A1B3P5T0_EOGHI|nr:odorant receptor [Eogystia hippophaecolus]